MPGEDLKDIFSSLEFTPVPTRAATRALLKAQKAGKTTVDISGTGQSSSNGSGNTGGNGNSGGGKDDDPLG